MMRALWSGVLSFGLVNIPVNLYPGSDEKGLAFTFLHKKDMSPIKYAKMCKATGEEVPFEEIVRGYEYRKGDFVILESRDFKSAGTYKPETIEIISFTPEKDVPVSMIEKPFYLEPRKEVRKAYQLLRETMLKAGKVGIGKFVLKTREHLCMLKPEGSAIMLIQMRYYSELKRPDELDLPVNEKIVSGEIGLALKLIEHLAKPFQPGKIKDTYTETLKELIAMKSRGKTYHVKEEKAAPTKVVDLMEKLKKSLEEKKEKQLSKTHA